MNYTDITTIKYKSIEGVGPWVASDKQTKENTWNIVEADWVKFKKLFSLSKKQLIVQAGGWQGLYPRLLSDIFDLVYTFEPDPVNFYCLTQNCQKHNIFKFQAALSDTSGVLDFEEVATSGQGRVVKADSWQMPVLNKYRVPSIAVDDLNLPSCSFLMYDIENYDIYALLGSVKTIKKYKPLILVEKSFKDENNIKIFELLTSLGYIVKYDFPNDLFFIPFTAHSTMV